MEHQLKTVQPYFDDVKSGVKTFELRRYDRPYRVGDELLLVAWDEEARGPLRETPLRKRVTYILQGGHFGLERGYVILGLGEP